MVRNVFIIIFYFILVTSSFSSSDKMRSADEKIAKSMGVLHGKVEFINHPMLGRTSASGFQISFQSMDYPKMAFGMRTDSDGHYIIVLSKGKYRVFAREIIEIGSNKISWDWLSTTQKRFIEITPYNDQKMDIELVFPQSIIDRGKELELSK